MIKQFRAKFGPFHNLKTLEKNVKDYFVETVYLEGGEINFYFVKRETMSEKDLENFAMKLSPSERMFLQTASAGTGSAH